MTTMKVDVYHGPATAMQKHLRERGLVLIRAVPRKGGSSYLVMTVEAPRG